MPSDKTDSNEAMENNNVTNIVIDRNVERLKLVLDGEPSHEIIAVFEAANIIPPRIDFSHADSSSSHTELTFILASSEMKHAEQLLEQHCGELRVERIRTDYDITAIYLTGYGIGSSLAIIAEITSILNESSIPIQELCIDEERVICFVESKSVALATTSLQHAFGRRAQAA